MHKPSHPLIYPIPHVTPRPRFLLALATPPTHHISQRPLRLPTHIPTLATIPRRRRSRRRAWTALIGVAIQTHMSAICTIVTVAVGIVPVVRVLRAVVFQVRITGRVCKRVGCRCRSGWWHLVVRCQWFMVGVLGRCEIAVVFVFFTTRGIVVVVVVVVVRSVIPSTTRRTRLVTR